MTNKEESSNNTFQNNNNSTYQTTQRKLIITEKPSVAAQFAKALGVDGKQDGYIENNDWIITWCIGHLVTLSYPEKYDAHLKSWNLTDLPFLPEQYKYEVIADVKKQFGIVKTQLNRTDVSEIYNAGDSGREGEYIQRLVYTQAGHNPKARIRRVWIDSQTDDEIKRGIREAKPESVYDNLSNAAYMRAIEDYAIGINLSRALSCKFGYEFNKRISSSKYRPLAVGRVMTCVLGLIVEREIEIRNFRPVDFYKIDAAHDEYGFASHWKAVKGTPHFESNLLYNDTGFKSKADAESFLSMLQLDPKMIVDKAESKIEKKNAPLLYNLAELQSDCAKKFKISPDETLAVAQRLYEAKLTTYPRTDARVLSTAISKEISKNISGLTKNTSVNAYAEKILQNNWMRGIEKTRYCDDSKITDHYAIIPTGVVSDNFQSNTDRLVYGLIVKRFLSIFYPAAEYSKVSVELLHDSKERFFASEKQLVSTGYLEVLGKDAADNDASDGNLVALKKGMTISSDFKMLTSTTQPPKRYTSGSMILAMENAGNLIEDEDLRAQIKGSGIGTSATRAEVISKLVKNDYIGLDKKTQVLAPTNTGFAVYDIVKDNIPSMLSPRMTASWEKGLSEIESGAITQAKYRQTLEKFVTDTVTLIKGRKAEQGAAREKSVVGKCPVCGKDLYMTEKGYFCSGYKKGDKKSCKFAFSKTLSGVPIPQEQVNKLLAGEKTDVLHIIGQKGDYDVCLIIKDGAVELEFPKDESDIICPNCGNNLMRGKYEYECSCGFKVQHLIAGIELSEDQVQSLFTGGKTELIHGFKKKNGGTFDAIVTFNGSDTGFEFPSEESDFVCPKCGKPMRKDDYSYFCDCGFKIRYNIAHRILTKEELECLITNGKTEELTGFIKKDGSPFKKPVALIFKNGNVEFDFPESAGTKSKPAKGSKT